jgi:hypothetical protein
VSRMRTNVSVGVSFNREKLAEIDSRRGYISRSKWILLALETMTQTLENKVKKSVQPVSKIEPLEQAVGVSQSPEGAYEHYE